VEHLDTRRLADLSEDGVLKIAGLLRKYLATDRLQDYTAYARQLEFHAAGRHYQNRLLSAGNQQGKSFANSSTYIKTLNDFVRIDRLCVGDRVLGLDGRWTEVLGVYPQGVRKVYRVTARDGSSLVADADHLWMVRFGKKEKWTIRTTEEMHGRMQARLERHAERAAQPNAPAWTRKTPGGYYELPARPVVEMPERDLPLDPRLLGILLGDGCMAKGGLEIVCADPWLVRDIGQRVERYNCRLSQYGVFGKKNRNGMTYGIVSQDSDCSWNANRVKKILRELDLWGKNSHYKYIPDEYKNASVRQRIELLSGLMDTDGCAEKNGRRIFVSVSERLARDVAEILHSLGMNASVTLKNRKVDGVERPIWRVHVHAGGFRLFRLPRKREREDAHWKEQKAMRITSIEPAGEEECTCIKVAAADGMFLAGREYIPTHNTYSGGAEVGMHLTGEYPPWWQGLRFSKPTLVWAAGQNGVATRDNVQRMLLGDVGQIGTGWIPKRCIVREMSAMDKNTSGLFDYVYVRHVTGGLSMLRFRNYEQKREAWQGPSVNLVWFDEEPPEDLYEEGLARTIATDGSTMMTFTPLLGFTRVVGMYMGEQEDGSERHYTRMTIWDSAHFDEAKIRRQIAKFPRHQRRARIEGLPLMGVGQIFPYEKEDIQIAPFPVPDHFHRLCAIDVASSSRSEDAHPTAAVELAWDKDSDTVYVLREYRRKGMTPSEHWRFMRAWGERRLWAWPKDAMAEKGTGRQIMKLYQAAGMRTLHQHAQYLKTDDDTQGWNTVSVERGVMDMEERFLGDTLKIFRTCPMLTEEVQQYHRDKDAKIVKERDDLIDAVRYGIMMLRHSQPIRARDEAGTMEAELDPMLGF